MNNLNQYTGINTESTENAEEADNSVGSVSSVFNPSYDADGNMTQVLTSTGTWSISYNGENRPIRFENTATQTVVECIYDSQGRRFEKKVTVAGTLTLRERYLYRGYLQIAAFDVTEATGSTQLSHALKHVIFWDPTEPVATRPLAINIINGGIYFPTTDLTKNVCELVDAYGDIAARYDYAPFGAVSAGTPSGTTVPANPLQWSSEVYDSELDLVYYNYRHYSPSLGRFLSRDPIQEKGGLNLYITGLNNPFDSIEILGASFLSFALKAGAKTASKAMLKNFIETQIRTKIKRLALKNHIKRFSKEADELIGILEDPWWVTCIGFIPVVGDVFDLVNVPVQIKRAINKADLLQSRVEKILSIQGQRASSLLQGKFKHLIGDDPLLSKTYVELKNISLEDSGPSKRARTIIKLIDEAHRLNEKI